MNDHLDRRLRSWETPPVPPAFAERMERLFAEPPARTEHVVRRRVALWPAAAFGTVVAVLVSATVLTEPWSSDDGATARLIQSHVHVGPLRPADAVPEVASQRADVDRLEYVTRVQLDGYVPVRNPRIVVERRSR
jgi:hypothetical protein